MKRFCKDIGIDKKSLLNIFVGGVPGGANGHNLSKNEVLDQSNTKNESGRKDSRDSGTLNSSENFGPISNQINTGVAA